MCDKQSNRLIFDSRIPQNSILWQLDPEKIPRHLAIIMDGNGRWAQAQGKERSEGHFAGYNNLREIIRAASYIRIESLTVYAFSTENFKRPQAEVEFLMSLFATALENELGLMMEENLKFNFIGDIDNISEAVRNKFLATAEHTKNNTGLKFNMAVNYGGQDEIVRAMKKIAARAIKGEINLDDISANMVDNSLDTAGLPPVDLVIRTSGDIRLSNFLLWQSAYAEYYFTDINWPDFNPEELGKALLNFAARERRFGGLKKK